MVNAVWLSYWPVRRAGTCQLPHVCLLSKLTVPDAPGPARWRARAAARRGRARARTHGVRVAGDLLVGGRDDEVRGVHGDQVGGELAAEVVLVLQLLPAARCRVGSGLLPAPPKPCSPRSCVFHAGRGCLQRCKHLASGAGAAPLRGAHQYTSASAYLRTETQQRIRTRSHQVPGARRQVPVTPGAGRMQTGAGHTRCRAHANRQRDTSAGAHLVFSSACAMVHMVTLR
jgi:hypothetical protein